jgi:hypothetical protein
VSSDVVSSCTLQEFQQFDSFFSKFMIVAREFFLPSERHRFGLVLERSMLSSLGLEDSGSWLAMAYIAGCPSCSKIIEKEDDLKNVLQMDNSVVMEVILTCQLISTRFLYMTISCAKNCVAKTLKPF